MKNFIQIVALLLGVLLANGSSAQIKGSKGFIINGTITGAPDSAMVRLVDIDGQKYLDSAYIKNNKFTLKGSVARPTIGWLQCKGEYATIILENTSITFTSPFKNMFLEHRAVGGKEQALINEMEKRQYKYNKIYWNANDSLQNNKNLSTADKKRLATIYNSAVDSAQQIYVNFGKQHPNTYYGQDIIYRNRKRIMRDTVQQLYLSMSPELKLTTNGQALKTFLYSTLAEKGKPMIDFEVKDINGKPFKLSSLKGRYIFLTFGSIGCGPCRTENKALAANYSKLSPNLEIVSFSLDRQMEHLKRMVKEDGVVWHTVSDLKGDGPVKTQYNVQGIPTAFLIDKEGIIVEKFDGYSPDLVSELEKKIKAL